MKRGKEIKEGITKRVLEERNLVVVVLMIITGLSQRADRKITLGLSLGGIGSRSLSAKSHTPKPKDKRQGMDGGSC